MKIFKEAKVCKKITKRVRILTKYNKEREKNKKQQDTKTGHAKTQQEQSKNTVKSQKAQLKIPWLGITTILAIQENIRIMMEKENKTLEEIQDVKSEYANCKDLDRTWKYMSKNSRTGRLSHKYIFYSTYL